MQTKCVKWRDSSPLCVYACMYVCAPLLDFSAGSGADFSWTSLERSDELACWVLANVTAQKGDRWMYLISYFEYKGLCHLSVMIYLLPRSNKMECLIEFANDRWRDSDQVLQRVLRRVKNNSEKLYMPDSNNISVSLRSVNSRMNFYLYLISF